MSEGRRLAPAPTVTRSEPGSGALPYAYEMDAFERRAAMGARSQAPHHAVMTDVADNTVVNLAQFAGSTNLAGLGSISDVSANIARGEKVGEAVKDTAHLQRQERGHLLLAQAMMQGR